MKLRQLKSQVNEGPFDALKSASAKIADKFTDASGEGEKSQYIKDQQTKFLRWSNQTQNSKDPNNFDNIIKYVTTQLGLGDVSKLYAIAGVEQQQQDQQQQGQQQSQPQQDQQPDPAIFKDAAKFRAEWDEFVKQNPNYKLIADPDLLAVLKDIWMRSGGTKLESLAKSGTVITSKELYTINNLLEGFDYNLSSMGYSAKRVTGGFVLEQVQQYKSVSLLTEQKSYSVWQKAGRMLAEAQLTADQINQIFANVEQGATAAGGNRTMLGKGKDAASAVNAAWEDLKTKVQNSGPIKNVDSMYDQAAEKLKQATGGDQGVMKYVQMYRDFAKKHPVAQSLIYSALIAAAGISGAGLGGAAALGLFKMVDKLLQGEKFSSAAYSGAKTGAMAYAAGQVGQAVKGAPQGGDAGASAAQAGVAAVRQQASNEAFKAVQQAISNGTTGQGDLASVAQSVLEKYSTLQGGPLSVQTAETLAQKIAMQAMVRGESVLSKAPALNESQIKTVFKLIAVRESKKQLKEAGWDQIKQKASTIGHNLTTKVTADKLASAWKKAGSPTDSDELAKFLAGQGVDTTVAQSAIQTVSGTQPQDAATAASAPNQQDAEAPQKQSAGSSVFSDYKKLRAAWEAFQEQGKGLPPQVRGVLKDILQTALKTVESVQINELGNRPNDSSDPRTAGGVANAVGNLKDRRRAMSQNAAQSQQSAGQTQQQSDQTLGQADQSQQAASGASQPAATGVILKPEQTAQVWAEVIRTLYDSGKITSDPGNNPINRAANVMGALAGKAPVQSKVGMKWKDSSTMTQDIINSLDSLTPDDARRLAGILTKRAQQQ
jgi:hypothetical protein